MDYSHTLWLQKQSADMRNNWYQSPQIQGLPFKICAIEKMLGRSSAQFGVFLGFLILTYPRLLFFPEARTQSLSELLLLLNVCCRRLFRNFLNLWKFQQLHVAIQRGRCWNVEIQHLWPHWLYLHYGMHGCSLAKRHARLGLWSQKLWMRCLTGGGSYGTHYLVDYSETLSSVLSFQSALCVFFCPSKLQTI